MSSKYLLSPKHVLTRCRYFQLLEREGRARGARAARSLGERSVTELILQHQNPQQLSANLWAAVRARGCQFLGPAMQEEVLKLVLLALEDGSALSRKVEGHVKGTQLIFCQGACDVCGPEVGTSLSSSKQDFHRPCSSASLSSQLLQGDEARRGQLIDATERRVPYVRHPAPRTRHPDRADCHGGRSKDCSRPVE